MIGVRDFGAYIPFHRLRRSEVAEIWGNRSEGGEKAVANYDEDSVTMAVAAGLNCFNRTDPQSIVRLNP